MELAYDSGTRRMYEFINNKNEKIFVEITEFAHNKKSKTGLMSLWVKHGYLKTFIEKTLNVTVYVKDEEGNCYGKYNPQVYDHKCEINFEWMLEATPENEKKILKEIEQRANAL